MIFLAFRFIRPSASICCIHEATMKFGLILLASLPAIFAENAALVPRAELVAEAEQSGCAIPSDFHIKQFETKWDRNGTSIASLKFTYVNSATDSSTSCRFWKHSRPEKRAGGAAHYACTNKEAAFSWQADEKKLTIIQQACPNEKGYVSCISCSTVSRDCL